MGILLVLWGPLAALTKIVLAGLDSYQFQFYLFLFSVMIMTIYLGATRRLRDVALLTPGQWVTLSLYALPSYLYYFFYTLALKSLPAVEASILNYLFPIMIVVFAVPINGERLDLRTGISVVLGLVGAIMVLSNGRLSSIGVSNLVGDICAILAAVSWGVFSNLAKKNRLDTQASNFVYIFVSLVLATISLFLFSRPVAPGITHTLGILWLSVSNIVLGYYVWLRLLKSASAAMAASLSFITPFVTGERIGAYQFAGLLVILAGVAAQKR